MRRFFFLVWIVSFFASVIPVLGHGGEDHGAEKTKTVSDEKGTVLHTSRLGEFEMSFKHPQLMPDTATSALLFITRFSTNEPLDKGEPAVEFESTNGTVTEAVIERTGTAGSYKVSVPALPEGGYTVRTKLTYEGETDTATFSGVEVAHKSQLLPDNSGTSWVWTGVIGLMFLVITALFGGLTYFFVRFSDTEPMREEAASV